MTQGIDGRVRSNVGGIVCTNKAKISIKNSLCLRDFLSFVSCPSLFNTMPFSDPFHHFAKAHNSIKGVFDDMPEQFSFIHLQPFSPAYNKELFPLSFLPPHTRSSSPNQILTIISTKSNSSTHSPTLYHYQPSPLSSYQSIKMGKYQGKNNNLGSKGRGAGAKKQTPPKVCTFCNKSGHVKDECFKNPSNKTIRPDHNNNRKQNNNGGGSFSCKFCKMNNHSDAECTKKGNPNRGKGNHQQSGGNQQSGFNGNVNYQHPMVIQPNNTVPMNQANAIPFSNPCQLCGAFDHYAPARPNLPTLAQGTYYPQQYPPPPNNPAFASYSSTSSNYDDLDEVDMNTYPAPISVMHTPPQQTFMSFGYDRTEMGCQHTKMQDSDGDALMTNAEDCGECISAPRATDRIPSPFSFQTPSYQMNQYGNGGYSTSLFGRSI